MFGNHLNTIGLMHYPNNNCAIGGALNPQDVLPSYLTHASATGFFQFYSGILGELPRGIIVSDRYIPPSFLRSSASRRSSDGST